ncbi:MAG: fused phosphoenolpyruvate-protein phosphotransferase PtsP/GAF domain protein [bacterium ADurb.Bin429]|nr:MAG: fused phosphoenolpyruvate-protein phosphotransferase PtsP/GAF domain protein [bacterium ADurb.Bin429]
MLLPRLAPPEGLADATDALLALLSEALTAFPVAGSAPPLFTERLSGLSQLSWTLNGLHDQDAILHRAIEEAPQLVDAESATIWLWDADQQAPVMRIDEDGPSAVPKLPPSLLTLLRQTAETDCAYSLDAGESDARWPTALRGRPVAFLPLPVPHGCLGIMSVQHRPTGFFTHDDIFLLSALGSHVATAITNAQLHESERHLVSLLQTSIRQVVSATARRQNGPAEFVESLVQVTEGLTRGDLVFAWLEVGEPPHPLSACSGTRRCSDDALTALGTALLDARRREAAPALGALGWLDALDGRLPDGVPETYTLADIRAGDRLIGVLVVCGAGTLGEEQQAFLQTMAVQIGAGVESIEKSANIERMLFQMSNINYVSDAISSTFDPQRILSVISMAASQALNMPIVLAGWHLDDGTMRVFPDTSVGVSAECLAGIRLTDHNAVIRKVLETGASVTSRDLGARAPRAFPMLAELHPRDWICVPMMVKGRARGIILVADTVPRVFSARDTALLATYANQAALAMENSLLVEQVERQLRQMELLYRLSHSFFATLDEQVIHGELLHVAREALQAPAAMLCTVDARTGAQQMAQALGITPADPGALRWDTERGIIGAVYKMHAPVVSMNLATDGRDTLLRQLARDHDFVAALAVPIQLHEETLGTLLVFTRAAREFTTADQQLLQAIATEAAAAIHNARIHLNARRASDHLGEVMHTLSHGTGQLLGLVTSVLEAARAEDAQDESAARARQRLAVVTEAHARLSDESPDLIDVWETVAALLDNRALTTEDDRTLPVELTGARLSLPVYSTALLALYVIEQLAAIQDTRDADAPALPVIVGFHRLGNRDLLVEIKDTGAAAHTRLARPNPVIIQAARQELLGSLSEVVDGGVHHVRFRFPRPTMR